MITYYLGDAEVEGYARDLAGRLDGDSFPTVWVTLGHSGNVMAREVTRCLPQKRLETVRVVRAVWDRTKQEVEFQDDFNGIVWAESRVLVIDSAIHSGNSMLAVVERLADVGAKNVISYSLVLKKSSMFIPNFFGVIIADEDRAYFKLPEIPNNRLMKKKESFGYIRPIRDDDALRPDMNVETVEVGISFGELLYQSKVANEQVYLFMDNGRVCGFVCFRIVGSRLILNILASDVAYRGRGVGAALVRWAETLARSSRCEVIELWAINDKVGFYQRLGFVKKEASLQYNAQTSFTHMSRKILYNTKEHVMDEC